MNFFLYKSLSIGLEKSNGFTWFEIWKYIVFSIFLLSRKWIETEYKKLSNRMYSMEHEIMDGEKIKYIYKTTDWQAT